MANDANVLIIIERNPHKLLVCCLIFVCLDDLIWPIMFVAISQLG